MARPPSSVVGIILSIVASIISALAITPFHVAIARLSLQERTAPLPPVQALGAESGILAPQVDIPPPLEGVEFAGAEEDVVNIRSGQEPYKGLFNCMKCIAKEEGLSTLWRGWYVLALFAIFSEVPYRVAGYPSGGVGKIPFFG